MKPESEYAAGELFQAFFESSADAIVVSDSAGTIVMLNSQAERLFGYARQELIGDKIEQLLPAHLVAIHAQRRATYLSAPHPCLMGAQDQPLWARHRDGRQFAVEISLSPLHMADRLLVAATLRDSSERQHDTTLLRHFNQVLEQQVAEQVAVLAANRAELQDFLDNAADLIQRVDTAGRFLYVNRAWCSILGYRATEALNLSFRDIVHPDHRAACEDIFARLCANQPVERIEVMFVGKDGRQVLVEGAMTTYYRDGRLHSTQGIFRDVSAHKQQEQTLQQAKEAAEAANRASSEFLATMSHEIRTPLNAIIGFSELLKKQLSAETELRRYIDGIHTGSRNLLQLLNDVLDLARLEAGKLQIVPEQTHLRALAEEIRQIFAAELEKKGIGFAVEIPFDTPAVVLLDTVRIRQILLNLVGNAVKFTHSGRVRLGIGCVGTPQAQSVSLVFVVQDTGIGIPRAQQRTIFEAFRQRDARDARYGGAGLGLAITKRLVELLNGHISLRSKPGVGTLFRVQLNDLTVPTAAAYNDSTRVTGLHFRPATVLIAGSATPHREVLQAILRGYPFQLLLADSDEQALLYCRDTPLDLIFVDHDLPPAGGAAWVQQLRTDPRLAAIPVIALLAEESNSDSDSDNGPTVPFGDTCLRTPPTRQSVQEALKQCLPCTEVATPSAPTALPAPAPDAELAPVLVVSAAEPIPPALVQQFQADIVPLYQALKARKSMGQIKNFAAAIRALGETYTLTRLTAYGEALLAAVSAIRIAEINRQLEAFAELQDVIENADSC